MKAALAGGPAGEALVAASVAQGFSEEVARAGIAAELESWSEAALETLVRDVAAERGRWPRAVLVLAARTLPASAMRQCLLARALGATVHVKAASGQEALAEALALADPQIVPRPFGSGDGEALRAAIAEVDSVVVLGSDEAVAAVRAVCPRDKGFAGHGHKVSAALVVGWPSEGELGGLAMDLLAWDQAGCLAPQGIWCEGDRAVRRALAEGLAAAVRACEESLPVGAGLVPAQAQARRAMTTLATMLGEEAFETGSATLALHPESTFRMSPGPRSLWVLPLEGCAGDGLGPIESMVPHLSSLAVVGAEAQAFARRLPSTVRVCRAGELQRPPLRWFQDGLHPLRSLLRP